MKSAFLWASALVLMLGLSAVVRPSLAQTPTDVEATSSQIDPRIVTRTPPPYQPSYFPMMGMMSWPGYGYRYGYGWDGGYSFHPFMILWWILGIIFLVWLFRFILGSRRHDRFRASSSALDILKERYAKGEITKAEYESMKKDIE